MADVGFSSTVWWEILVLVFTCFTADVDDQAAGVLPIEKGGLVEVLEVKLFIFIIFVTFVVAVELIHE